MPKFPEDPVNSQPKKLKGSSRHKNEKVAKSNIQDEPVDSLPEKLKERQTRGQNKKGVKAVHEEPVDSKPKKVKGSSPVNSQSKKLRETHSLNSDKELKQKHALEPQTEGKSITFKSQKTLKHTPSYVFIDDLVKDPGSDPTGVKSPGRMMTDEVSRSTGVAIDSTRLPRVSFGELLGNVTRKSATKPVMSAESEEESHDSDYSGSDRMKLGDRRTETSLPKGSSIVVEAKDVPLTVRQKSLINQSWKLIHRTIEKSSVELFVSFFKHNPKYLVYFDSLKDKTPDDLRTDKTLRAHALIVCFTLSAIIERGFHDDGLYKVQLHKIASRHLDKHVQGEYLEDFFTALKQWLRGAMGAGFTAELQQAWITFETNFRAEFQRVKKSRLG